MNSDGTGQTQLTHDIDFLGPPAWSADGQWIAFDGVKFYEEPEPGYDLWLIDRSGKELKHLPRNREQPRFAGLFFEGYLV